MARSPSKQTPARPGFRSSEAFQQSILATVPDAMVVIDDHGAILSFSAAAERMFGYTEAEVAGRNVSMLMPTPDAERHDAYIARFLRTGQARIIGVGRVTTARRADGTTFPIELAIGDASSPDGRLFTGFIRDLTERQAADRRLQDLQAELSHMSRISAMGSLASALAHELNQPLTAIANYTEAARDLLDSPDHDTLAMVREALAEAAGQSIRAGQIVRRLRDFIARGESEKRVESLRTLVAEASALGLVGSGDLGIDTLVEIEPEADTVLVDRIQVQQVLLNLIRNAVEAMQGAAMRRLEITARAEPRNMVRVTVADSGSGLDPAVAPHLFEPFRSTKAMGMGLGLSISRTIVEAQGGRIWATPSIYGGTAFHFTLMGASLGPDGG